MRLRGPNRKLDFSDLHLEACNYIECVVWSMLSRTPNDLESLRLFAELWADDSVEKIDVYTLNHDTVLEQFCAARGIALTHGFGAPVNLVKYWTPALLNDDEQRMRLLKLHGSVNWFQFPSHGEDWSSRYVGIPLDHDLWHTKDRKVDRQWPSTGRPKMLIGTSNKLMSYTTGIFADLHFRFYRNMAEADALVVCGYGFGDKGINTRLLEWVSSSPERRAVVIDPGLEELQWTARGAVRRSWKEVKESGKLVLMDMGIEEAHWAEVRRALRLSA